MTAPADAEISAEEPAWFAAEHAKERARIREILARDIAPYADAWEAQHRIDPQGWRNLAKAGLLSLPHTSEGFLVSALFLEELGRLGYAGIRAAVAVHAYMASSYIARFGSAWLKEAYLPAVRDGRTIMALAISEENAGSDLRHLATRAVPDEAADGFRVSGRKLHVANGSQAGCFVTLVRTGDTTPALGLAGTSLLLVEADAPGVTRVPEPMLGWHAADVCPVEFENVLVPSDRLIGKPGRAVMYIVEALDFERLAAGLLALGGAAHCLEVLDAWIREHRVRDTPLSDYQAVRHQVADLRAELAVVRQYAYHGAWLQSRGCLDTRDGLCAQAEGHRADCGRSAGLRTASRCERLQCRFHPGAPLRDAIAGTIAAGATEVLRDLIFEA